MDFPLAPPSTLFEDRVDAGAKLTEALLAYRRQDVIVLGIPAGGVIVATAIGRALDAELDVIVARKVGVPHHPGLAVGAVTSDGTRYVNARLAHELGISDSYLERVSAREQQEARAREELFRGGWPSPRVAGRLVIVVDDGLATGATIQAAVRSVRARSPRKVVAAVPVGCAQACDAIRTVVDSLVCLYEPEPFYAVGLFYKHFEPVSDEDVHRALRDAWRYTKPAVGAV